jgi:hypothetical protein
LAHFAQLENNIVKQVIVVSNQDILNEQGQESEDLGINFCFNLLGGTWKQTSYNGNIRKNYAGIGYTYDESRDAFIAPKPYNSWLLDEDTCQWKAPIPYPNDEQRYKWNETILNWVNIANEGEV